MDNEDRFKRLDRIDKIAELLRSLTYGEMIELASELRKTAGETEITAETLPRSFTDGRVSTESRPGAPSARCPHQATNRVILRRAPEWSRRQFRFARR